MSNSYSRNDNRGKAADHWSALISMLERHQDSKIGLEMLRHKGGWRTLFDILSSEWQDSEIGEKIIILNTFAPSVSVLEMADRFYNYHVAMGREDIAKAVRPSLAELRQYGLFIDTPTSVRITGFDKLESGTPLIYNDIDMPGLRTAFQVHFHPAANKFIFTGNVPYRILTDGRRIWRGVEVIELSPPGAIGCVGDPVKVNAEDRRRICQAIKYVVEKKGLRV